MADGCLDRPYVSLTPALFRGKVGSTPFFPHRSCTFRRIPSTPSLAHHKPLSLSRLSPGGTPTLQSAEEVTESPSRAGPCVFGPYCNPSTLHSV